LFLPRRKLAADRTGTSPDIVKISPEDSERFKSDRGKRRAAEERKHMTELIKKTGRVLAPLLVHLGVTFVLAFLGITFHMIWNLGSDEATLLTSLSALCSIPLLGKMWKADRLQLPSAVKRQNRGWV